MLCIDKLWIRGAVLCAAGFIIVAFSFDTTLHSVSSWIHVILSIIYCKSSVLYDVVACIPSYTHSVLPVLFNKNSSAFCCLVSDVQVIQLIFFLLFFGIDNIKWGKKYDPKNLFKSFPVSPKTFTSKVRQLVCSLKGKSPGFSCCTSRSCSLRSLCWAFGNKWKRLRWVQKQFY